MSETIEGPVFLTAFTGPGPTHERLAEIVTVYGEIVARCPAVELDDLCRRWLAIRAAPDRVD